MLELIMELLNDVKEYGFDYRELEKEVWVEDTLIIDTLIYENGEIIYCHKVFGDYDGDSMGVGKVGTIEDTPEYIESQCDHVWYNSYPIYSIETDF